jgi:hypothetical protein
MCINVDILAQISCIISLAKTKEEGIGATLK